MNRLNLSVLVSLTLLWGVQCQRYIVPEATLQFLSPRGLRISIPDTDPDVSLVAFHININEEFDSLTHGHFARDIIKKRDGKWSYYIPEFKVKQGDTIYYWIYVIVDKLGYHGLDRSYTVTQANPHAADPTITPATTLQPVDTLSSCRTSQSSKNRGKLPGTVCQGEVLLDKSFDSIDGWSHQVTIGGSQPDDEFTIFTKDSSVSWLENGELVIKPTLLEEKYNDSFVRSGQLILEGCTSANAEYCTRQAHAYLILPPVISARLNTKNNFSFRYGTLEIKAKFPQGDWIVPELWLEPVSDEPVARVVIGLSRGNTDKSEFGGQSLEAGVVGNSWSSLGKKVQEFPWSQDYHTFKLHWTPDEMEFSVDDQEIHRLTLGASNSERLSSLFDKEMYISLGVHVAGSRDFPDNIDDKPWKNFDPKPLVWESYRAYIVESYAKMERFARFWDAKSIWYPTWKENSVLHVKSIKITAL